MRGGGELKVRIQLIGIPDNPVYARGINAADPNSAAVQDAFFQEHDGNQVVMYQVCFAAGVSLHLGECQSDAEPASCRIRQYEYILSQTLHVSQPSITQQQRYCGVSHAESFKAPANLLCSHQPFQEAAATLCLMSQVAHCAAVLQHSSLPKQWFVSCVSFMAISPMHLYDMSLNDTALCMPLHQSSHTHALCDLSLTSAPASGVTGCSLWSRFGAQHTAKHQLVQ